MESPFAKLFIDIMKQITNTVTEVQYIEQNLGQLGSEEPRKMLAFPAVLIDFSQTSFEALLGNNQLATPTISVILIFDNYSQTNSLAPNEVRQIGLNYLEIEQKVVMALHGWQTNYCQPLTRTMAKSLNQNELGLRVRELTFTTEYEDRSCDNSPQYLSIGLSTE